MSVLDYLTAALQSAVSSAAVSAEAEKHVAEICLEAEPQRSSYDQRLKLSGLPAWESLKTSEEDFLTEVAVLAALLSASADWFKSDVTRMVASHLLRKKLPYREDNLQLLLAAAATQPYLQYGMPLGAILGAVEQFCQDKPPPAGLRQSLQAVKAKIDDQTEQHYPSQFLSKTGNRIDAILEPQQGVAASMPDGKWRATLVPWLEGLTDKKRDIWIKLLTFAATASDKSKPTRKWLETAKPLVSGIGRPSVAAQLSRWLTSTTPDPTQVDVSLDILKGLIWASVHLKHDIIAPAIGRFAETCFRKVPDYGARSVKLGNACVAALSSMKKADAAIAELVRLKTRIKYGSVRDLINRRLAEIAEVAGITVADLEESALPDFGLGTDGNQKVDLGDIGAIITLDHDGATLSWHGADGQSRKAPPAAVKRDFADELKALKQKTKDLDVVWNVQVTRLEAAWIEDRAWSLNTWRARYLEHPLRKQISERLIWRIEDSDQPMDVMPSDGKLVSLDGRIIEPQPNAVVRLWHPLNADPDHVLEWRRHMMRAGLTQPIKQAHREVYVLTDAERTTDIYSNRFAAHILRQHQFRALCHARGWKYEFQGGWDSHNIPSRHVPHHNLTVEYSVDPVESEDVSEAYIPLHIATDQVRFISDDGEQVSLENIPPTLFSELMRDVDLFVAVTSVANDPNWTDGGPDGRYGMYWQEYAFGDLSQTASTRRELMAELVPKLAISDRLKVTDRCLEVQGKLHAYKIHLGSSNIQIMPSNKYLCIVRGRSSKNQPGVKLPFTGDNLLSIILSKAFMLVSDDKITDKTILSQLGR